MLQAGGVASSCPPTRRLAHGFVTYEKGSLQVLFPCEFSACVPGAAKTELRDRQQTGCRQGINSPPAVEGKRNHGSILKADWHDGHSSKIQQCRAKARRFS